MRLFSSRMLSAERTSEEQAGSGYFFYQHQKVYSFSMRYIKNKTVLEIGSGGGYGTSRLAQYAHHVTGIDKDAGAIASSKSRYKSKNLDYICNRVESFRTRCKYDVITCFQFIEHLQDPLPLLCIMPKILSQNGVVIISTPNAETSSFNENPYHYREYTVQELRQLLGRHFRKVELYGLFGDNIITSLEDKRKQAADSLKRLDPAGIRRFMPRGMRQVMFDAAAALLRKRLQTEDAASFSENNFDIKKYSDKAIDIIAVCKL